MRYRKLRPGALIVALIVGTLTTGVGAVEQPTTNQSNPAAAGFDHAGSDARAVEIADQVIPDLANPFFGPDQLNGCAGRSSCLG